MTQPSKAGLQGQSGSSQQGKSGQRRLRPLRDRVRALASKTPAGSRWIGRRYEQLDEEVASPEIEGEASSWRRSNESHSQEEVPVEMAKASDLLKEAIEDAGIDAEKRSCPPLFMIVLSLNAALGGFLFGYDTGVVSGAMLQIRTAKEGLGNLSALEQEIIVSSTIATAVLGSVISGEAQKRYCCGRRGAILQGSLWFIAGAVVMAFAQGVASLTAGRAIVGIAVGVMSHSVPLYISECAPAEMRGRLNTLNNMFIVLGQVSASLVCCYVASVGVPQGWRVMLGVGAAPAVILAAGFLVLPESPRYVLLANNSSDEAVLEAERILRRLRGAACDAAALREEILRTSS
eukprot:TRINITY_DN27013_c0_g1_i3.p1 TRINITY_DN27013_c0_g1~~TRINITY_DN27013_c0_g1_i3.p1  ORF type:complete len:347 (-),score=75.31 TRINITY_DN27013_c0_g1_i3:301-1341(-)